MTTVRVKHNGAIINFDMYLESGESEYRSGHPDNWHDGSPECCELTDVWVVGYTSDEIEVDEYEDHLIVKWPDGMFEITAQKLEELALEQAYQDARDSQEP